MTEDTLLYPEGREYGNNENGKPIGKYKNIYCHTELEQNSTRKIYYVYSTGEATPLTSLGENVDPIERTVYMTMQAQGFEDFMYFTNEEKPIGPGNTGTVNFGTNDQLEGRVHTNGDIVFSSFLNIFLLHKIVITCFLNICLQHKIMVIIICQIRQILLVLLKTIKT